MMTTIKTEQEIDFEYCAAAGKAPAEMLRPFNLRHDTAGKSQLEVHVIRLLSLHPELVKFRMEDFANMDEATQRALLEDIYQALDISFTK